MADIDMLIHEEDAQRIVHIMKKHGYMEKEIGSRNEDIYYKIEICNSKMIPIVE